MPGEKLKYRVDKSGKLAAVFEPILQREFALLKKVMLLYTWRNVPKYDDEGGIIAAEARKMSNKERDLYGYDFEINVYRDGWEAISTHSKTRLAWHELQHCQVEVDEDGKPAKDDSGRTVIYILPHDLVVRSFKDEVKKFGLAPVDVPSSRFLYVEWKKKKQGGDDYLKKMRRYDTALD